MSKVYSTDRLEQKAGELLEAQLPGLNIDTVGVPESEFDVRIDLDHGVDYRLVVARIAMLVKVKEAGGEA